MFTDDETAATAGVDLYWLPLGAGGHCVRVNGRVFEALAARHQHRTPRDLYHSALQVTVHGDRYVVEMAPVWPPEGGRAPGWSAGLVVAARQTGEMQATGPREAGPQLSTTRGRGNEKPGRC